MAVALLPGMTRGRRHRWAIVAVVLALLAAVAWWFDARTRPDRVGQRFVDGLMSRHPGTTVQSRDRGTLRAALPSGIYVEIRVPQIIDACRASRLHCGQALDDALDDVDHTEAATRAPAIDKLRPIVVGEPGGYRFGYVADPLAGPFEVRYALVDGIASTFATATIVDRLGLSRDALKAAGLAGLRRDEHVALDRIDVKGTTLFRVRADDDAPASLLDPERMRAFAARIGTHKLYAVIPLRGMLVVGPATDAAADALGALATDARSHGSSSLDGGILAYDVDAPGNRQLSVATLSPALRPP